MVVVAVVVLFAKLPLLLLLLPNRRAVGVASIVAEHEGRAGTDIKTDQDSIQVMSYISLVLCHSVKTPYNTSWNATQDHI